MLHSMVMDIEAIKSAGLADNQLSEALSLRQEKVEEVNG